MAIRWSSVSDDPLGACWHTGGWRRTSESRLHVRHADACGNLGSHIPECGGQGRGWFADHDRFTLITPNSQQWIQRNAAQEGYSKIDGGLLATTVREDIGSSAAAGADEITHVLDDPPRSAPRHS